MANILQYVKAGLCDDIHEVFPDIQNYKEPLLVSMGKLMRWHVTHLPTHLGNVLTNPKVITVALTIISMYAVQYIFYPAITAQISFQAIAWLAKQISYDWIHFGLYLSTMSFVLGNGLVAYGRFCQQEVMEKLKSTTQPLPKFSPVS